MADDLGATHLVSRRTFSVRLGGRLAQRPHEGLLIFLVGFVDRLRLPAMPWTCA